MVPYALGFFFSLLKKKKISILSRKIANFSCWSLQAHRSLRATLGEQRQRDSTLSEILLSVKQYKILLQVKWAELSEVQSLHLEGILVSSGSNEAQMRSEGADGSKGALCVRVGRYLSIWSYSCKCLESSSAPAGSLSFVSTVWHYAGRSGFWSSAPCYFPRVFGRLELKSLHQSTCPWLTSSASGIDFSLPVQAQKYIYILILQFAAPSMAPLFECSWGRQVPFPSLPSHGTQLTLAE